MLEHTSPTRGPVEEADLIATGRHGHGTANSFLGQFGTEPIQDPRLLVVSRPGEADRSCAVERQGPVAE